MVGIEEQTYPVYACNSVAHVQGVVFADFNAMLIDKFVGKAISIVEGLKASLNPEAGEISANLDDLSSYISGRLLTASTSEDTAILDEVGDLLREIKSAWDVLASQPGTQGAA